MPLARRYSKNIGGWIGSTLDSLDLTPRNGTWQLGIGLV